MSTAHFLTALFEFLLTAVMSVLVVYLNYRLFTVTNKDYDAESEIKKGNVAVAILLAALLFASGLIVKEGIYPVVNLVRLYFTSPTNEMSLATLGLFVLGHLALVFAVAVFTISLSLRFYGKLTRNIQEGEELKKGNAAVGIVLAAVVIVVAMYVSDGVSRLSKSLIPQPKMGQVQIMR